MNISLIRALIGTHLLMATYCGAQQLQIIGPDGRLFESITVGKFIVVELPDRFQSNTRYAGQLTQIGPETITMTIRSKTQIIPVSDIRALRRIGKFGAWARRSGRYIVPFSIATAGNITGDLTKGGKGINQLVIPAGASIGAGLIAYGLLHIPALKKASKGYTFKLIKPSSRISSDTLNVR